MIRLILLVLIAMMIYSFMKSKRELEKRQAQRDALNEKKDKAIEDIKIYEKFSVQDEFGRVFILTKDRRVYVYDSEKDSIEEIRDIKKVSTTRKYATVQSG